MIKKLSSIFIAVCVVFTMLAGISVSAADEFDVTYRVDYDKSIIHYEITTPARYRQIITVALTKGEGASGVVRAEYVHADNKGKAVGALQMTGDDVLGTYTIYASGAGYLENVSKDNIDVYYETYDDVYGEGGTLDRFNAASASDLGALFAEKKAMFNYNFEAGSDYAENSGMLHDMFVEIRKIDYEGAYTGFTQVQDTMTAISTIREITFAASVDKTRTLCENSATLLGVDTEHKDYKSYEGAIYKVLLSLFKEKTPQTITTLKKYIQQSIAIAKLNRVDAAEATDVVKTYGEVLGIDVAEYEEYIAEYDEIKFNYAFVGMNYTTATQVIAGYEARKLNPPAKTETPSDGVGGSGGSDGGSGGSGGGGGLGGSSGSSSTDPKIPYSSITVEDIKEEVSADEKVSLTDVNEEHWAYDYIKALSDVKVINGFEDGSFKPENTVTREQFVKMLVAAFEMKGEAEADYEDVPKDAWYYEAVMIATANNIANGYGNAFGIGSSITREDASVMVYRIINAEGEGNAFSDDGEISGYAKDAVYALSSAGVLNGMGDGSFAPKANLTRAQAAKIIYTALKYNIAK